jgi:hypothetical protein
MDAPGQQQGGKRADHSIESERSDGRGSCQHPEQTGGGKLQEMKTRGDQRELKRLTNPRCAIVRHQ